MKIAIEKHSLDKHKSYTLAGIRAQGRPTGYTNCFANKDKSDKGVGQKNLDEVTFVTVFLS